MATGVTEATRLRRLIRKWRALNQLYGCTWTGSEYFNARCSRMVRRYETALRAAKKK